MTDRDEELGRALRELPAPPHGEGFERRLHTLLADEAARKKRRSRRRRSVRAPRLIPALGGAVALAAIIVIVIALIPGDSSRIGGPQPASAAQIVDRARGALASVRSVRATLLYRVRINEDEPIRRERLRVLTTARGDLRILGNSEDGDFYYSAPDAREVQLRLPYAPGSFVTRGVAPGEPDGVIGDRTLGLGLASVTRALADSRQGAVIPQTVGGRRIWLLRTRIPVNKLGFSGDRLEVRVDRESGFPLSVHETLQGKLVRAFDFQDLALNRGVNERSFSPAIPSAATTVDEGFRTVSFDDAAARVGYAPLTPTALPRGYARAETRVAKSTPSPTGNEAMNPPSVDVVSTAYRSGIDRIVVSTRRTGEDPSAWADPIASGEGNLVEPEPVRLRGGALDGATANVVIDPRVEPHLYVVTDDLVVTITGPLTREELLRAAQSLRR